MQRLFTSSANGWPGFGLFIQRSATAIALLHGGISSLKKALPLALIFPEMIGAVSGLLLLMGLWTPAAGALVTVAELWIVLAGGGHLWISTLVAVLGFTLAMIGPGAWSIDARLFGRKHIGS